MGYSYLFTENTFVRLNDNKPFPGNWNIEHALKWSNFYNIGNLHLSLRWQWHTGKAFTQVTQNSNRSEPVSIYFDGINKANLPIYHRVDLSALDEFHIKENRRIKYRVGVSVFSFYNRKNLLSREFRTTPSLNNELIDTRVYSLKITPSVALRVL